MKILQTTPYLNKASGGPTTCIYQLTKGLVNIDTDCTILSFKPEEGDYLSSDSFIKYVADDRKTPLWLSANFRKELENSIEQYDLVHINTIWTWPSHIPVKIAKKAGKPIVISPHGMLYPEALKVSAWKKRIIMNLYVNKDLKTSDCIHATCDAEAQHIRNLGFTNPIAIIPNCIDISIYPEPKTSFNKKITFGFTGRLNPIKNIDLLLKAWKSLGDKTVNANLLIIGDGEQEYVANLKKYVKDNNLHNVSFTGFLSGQSLRDTIRSLDFQILPSKSENFGMVVAEALICGVPVIASKGTPWGILEERGCGKWIDAKSEIIADAIIDAIGIPIDKRKAMGKIGRNLVIEKFSCDAVAKQMKELYDWLLDKSEKPSFVYYD